MIRNKPVRRAKKLFDPDQVLTELDLALRRDFVQAQHEYCLDNSVVLYALNRQVNEFRKKYVSPVSSQDDLESAAYDKFLLINEHMGRVNSKLREELVYPYPQPMKGLPFNGLVHCRARALVRHVLGTFCEDEWFTECRNSSGSSIGVPFKDTSLEKKFTFPMSATKNAERLFERYLSFDTSLKDAIVKNNGETVTGWYRIVDSSRATTVDKSNTARRFISVEPTCNMFLQQGLMVMMYNRLRSVGLDVERLPILHRQLARHGSITGSLATIDWSSASDCVSIELLRWLLPPEWLGPIMLVRSPSTIVRDREIPLNMIATMGNATTFPLETLVFWAYATAINQTMRGVSTLSLEPKWLSQCSVFGDDCIVPSFMASTYIDFMTDIGFIVNGDKSFIDVNHKFRESCGGDYLDGFDVRPYFVKAPRSTRLSSLEPWLYIIGNAFIQKYISYFGKLSYVYDRELWRVYFSLFRRYKINIKLVPSYFPDDAGLKLSFDIERFNRHYELQLERIDRSNHGTYKFQYCRFQYKESSAWNDPIRYSTWLKTPSQSKRPDIPHESPIRKIGGYIVAIGISCHWHVPSVRKVG